MKKIKVVLGLVLAEFLLYFADIYQTFATPENRLTLLFKAGFALLGFIIIFNYYFFRDGE